MCFRLVGDDVPNRVHDSVIVDLRECNTHIFSGALNKGFHKRSSFEPRKKPSYFPLYWMVIRDPYNGLLESPYNWVV